MPGRRGLVVGALVGAALVAPWLAAARVGAIPPQAAAAVSTAEQPGVEAHVLDLLNGERGRAGLPILAVDGSMAAMARQHSQNMASANRIFHDLAKTRLLGRCAVVGENVGRATTGDVVHQAFMASPIHRSDILGFYDRVGIGVAAGPTMLYVAEVFCRTSAPVVESSPAPQPVAPTPAPKPARPKPARPSAPAPAPVPAAPPASEPGGMGSPCRLL